ncbi:MAG: hypothetical protein ACTSRK_09005 [Promethearchaeota archaeon]
MMKKQIKTFVTVIKMPPFCVGCTKESNGLNKYAVPIVKKSMYGRKKYNLNQKKAEVHFNLCARCESKSKKKQLSMNLWIVIAFASSLIVSVILGSISTNIFLKVLLGLIELIIIYKSARSLLIHLKFLRHPEIEFFRTITPEIPFLMAKNKQIPIQIQLKFRIPKVLIFFKAKISPIRSNITCSPLKKADCI